MVAYVALLRAVNVGGTGKLPMADLRVMCVEEGLEDVETYIASGNVVFTSDKSTAQVKKALETRLVEYFGRPCSVFVRSAKEMTAVLRGNPFPDAPATWTYAVFLDHAPPADAIDQARSRTTERIALGKREIYVAYGEGMGASKLKIPAAEKGTSRNLNTVAKLADLAAARQ